MIKLIPFVLDVVPHVYNLSIWRVKTGRRGQTGQHKWEPASENPKLNKEISIEKRWIQICRLIGSRCKLRFWGDAGTGPSGPSWAAFIPAGLWHRGCVPSPPLCCVCCMTLGRGARGRTEGRDGSDPSALPPGWWYLDWLLRLVTSGQRKRMTGTIVQCPHFQFRHGKVKDHIS